MSLLERRKQSERAATPTDSIIIKCRNANDLLISFFLIANIYANDSARSLSSFYSVI